MLECKYFQNLNEVIEPQNLVYLSKTLNFEDNFELMSLKVSFFGVLFRKDLVFRD